MTESVQIAIIASVPVTLTAIGGILLGLLNFRQGQKIHTQGEAIHIQVNGNLEAVKAELQDAKAKIEELRAVIDKLQDRCTILKV